MVVFFAKVGVELGHNYATQLHLFFSPLALP